MPSQGSYRDALLWVIDEVVAPGAASVNASGEFPRAQVDALGAACVMAPATDALHDFTGRALLGLPLLGEV